MTYIISACALKWKFMKTYEERVKEIQKYKNKKYGLFLTCSETISLVIKHRIVKPSEEQFWGAGGGGGGGEEWAEKKSWGLASCVFWTSFSEAQEIRIS